MDKFLEEGSRTFERVQIILNGDTIFLTDVIVDVYKLDKPAVYHNGRHHETFESDLKKTFKIILTDKNDLKKLGNNRFTIKHADITLEGCVLNESSNILNPISNWGTFEKYYLKN